MREQDFGNLQDDRMPVTKMQRNAYGCGPSHPRPVFRYRFAAAKQRRTAVASVGLLPSFPRSAVGGMACA